MESITDCWANDYPGYTNDCVDVTCLAALKRQKFLNQLALTTEGGADVRYDPSFFGSSLWCGSVNLSSWVATAVPSAAGGNAMNIGHAEEVYASSATSSLSSYEDVELVMAAWCLPVFLCLFIANVLLISINGLLVHHIVRQWWRNRNRNQNSNPAL